MGAGSKSGRGLGACTDANAVERGVGRRMGKGLGCRRGFGRGIASESAITKNHVARST